MLGGLVLVPTAARNLGTLASLTAMESASGGSGGRPILLCAPPGSGKTSTLRALARATNRLGSPPGSAPGSGISSVAAASGGGIGEPGAHDGGGGLLELHLDDSVDAKSLLGSYACGAQARGVRVAGGAPRHGHGQRRLGADRGH
jgi:MoxR-like ATPase